MITQPKNTPPTHLEFKHNNDWREWQKMSAEDIVKNLGVISDAECNYYESL